MYKLAEHPYIKPFSKNIDLRMAKYDAKKKELLNGKKTLKDFANGHEYYGFHELEDEWIYREWAPAADQVYLTGDFNNWAWNVTPLTKIPGTGDWEIRLPKDVIHVGSRVKTIVKNGNALTEHMPLYTRRAVQNPVDYTWCCEVYDQREGYPWTDQDFKPAKEVLIYEAHVGMAQEEERIGTYREFADLTLPRIQKAGYTTIQLMAIMEHPFYGSFGYQVSNFFAASSRYGMPEDLKYLINRAHNMGIRVLLDVVHSHAVKNTTEGINLFDGTVYQFFHDGPKGEHTTWGTKCFNYDNSSVIHFLLSNLKFWMDEYHFDGFRFDGVTSMLYWHHGLGVNFDAPEKYFSEDTDASAITYLQLANEMIREVNPNAITIAEDMSGMPGMTNKIPDGGIGFDFRLAMGLPDMWIKLVKEVPDEYWNMDNIWKELNFRDAFTIGYVESHDQALVGDKTMMFRLADAAMYTDMNGGCHSQVIDRAMALHMMIRLVTAASGGDGYLNFMGNEFGHPEWIDFPRPGNGSSFKYCRRQWSLLDNPFLKYKHLNQFDHDMIHTMRENRVFEEGHGELRYIHNDDKILAFERGELLFIFNFHPTKAFNNYMIPTKIGETYDVLFSSDDPEYNGYDRIARMTHIVWEGGIRMYLPPRTCIVLKANRPKKAVKK